MGTKTKIQMRSALRTDLKDAATLWTDGELNRCIDRAHSDLSRFSADEKIYEDRLKFSVEDESVTFPKNTDTDAIVAAEDIATVSSGDTCTLDGQPDVPRPLTATLTDANSSITGLTLIIDGVDKNNEAVQEVLYYSTGKSKTITGEKYFKAVYQVKIDQIAGNGAADVLNVGYGAYTDVWVYLANSPLKWGSESGVDAGAAALARGTDYYIDYANGRVKAISGGDIAAEEVCEFDYYKSQIGIDISDLTDLIRVHRVEYPVGSIPQSFVPTDVFGKYLVVSGSGESDPQERMAEGQQYRIYYDAKHHPPGEYTPGTAPTFLEDTVLLASAAYALFLYVLKLEHQAATDFASARTELSSITHVAWGTALTNAGTQATAAATALAKVATYLETNTSENAKHWLTKITTDIAGLRTAILTAQDAANTKLDTGSFTDLATHLAAADTALGKVNTYLVSNTNEDAKGWLTKITTDIAALRTAIATAVDAANTYLDAVAGDATAADAVRVNYMGTTANYVDGATDPGIKKYLTDGDAFLNAISDGGEGQEVPLAYREYANAVRNALVTPHERDREFKANNATLRTNAAMIFAQEAAQRLSNLRTYIEQAEGWGRIASGFVEEATQRIAEAAQIVNREAVITSQAEGYIREATSRLDNLRTYVEQADSWGRIATTFIGEAAQRISSAEIYIAEASSRLADMDRYLAEADRYTTLANQNMALADKFRDDAIERRNESWSIWRDRTGWIGDYSMASMRQIST